MKLLKNVIDKVHAFACFIILKTSLCPYGCNTVATSPEIKSQLQGGIRAKEAVSS